MILVAWQYSFKCVVAFTSLFVVAPVVLTILLPRATRLPQPGSQSAANPGVWLFILAAHNVLILGYLVSQLVSPQRKQHQALAEANQKLVSYAATLEQLATSREQIRLSRASCMAPWLTPSARARHPALVSSRLDQCRDS